METTNQIRSVKETVLSYLESKGDIADLSENDKLNYKYLDNRLIDSFGIIEMVTRFEQIFGITFEPHHMESEEFTTIGGLVKLIEEMRTKSPHL
jgi:acyl carrier protein